MTGLILIRHGVTQENLDYTLIGRTDPPLHPCGIRQAEALALALHDVHFDFIVSSPLRRCLQTAQHIAAKHFRPLPVVKEDALTEINLGIVDGMSSFLAYEQYRAIMDEALDSTLTDFRFPGGESRQEALERFSMAIYQLTREYPTGQICVVTHGGLLGLWLAHLHGDPLGRFRQWQPSHAAITRVTIEEQQFHLSVRGETHHLPGDLQDLIQQARERMA